MTEEIKGTEIYRWCNHHHEISEDHEMVEICGEKFVANKAAIPLLKALNEAGLRTRTHHYDGKDGHGFVGILLDNVSFDVRRVYEHHSSRDKYNGKFELLLRWWPHD